jgi:hypothetical protein
LWPNTADGAMGLVSCPEPRRPRFFIQRANSFGHCDRAGSLGAHPKKYAGLVEEMDRTGKVDRAYREITGRTKDPADAPIRLDPHDRLRHDQDRLAALYRKDAAKYREYREIDAYITKAVKDGAEGKQLFSELAVEEETPQPPLANLEPVAAPDAASVVPENAPPTALADDRSEVPRALNAATNTSVRAGFFVIS